MRTLITPDDTIAGEPGLLTVSAVSCPFQNTMQKPEHFRQEGPHDQQKILVGAIEGHLFNFKEGITSGEKLLSRLEPLIENLKILTGFQPTRWDESGPK